MTRITRRDCRKSLLGVPALTYDPRKSDGQEIAIPPQGIGQTLPTSCVIRDVADPRKRSQSAFSPDEIFTRTHCLHVSEDLLLLANGENIVAMQSYDDIRGYFENALPMALPIGRNSDRASVFTIFLVPPK